MGQAQFIGIAGRIGQDNSAAARRRRAHIAARRQGSATDETGDASGSANAEVSEGFSWANFHLLKLPSECVEANDTYLELGGTLVTCFIATMAVFGFRMFVNLAINWYRVRKGVEPDTDGAFMFPSWEYKIFEVQFLGLAESIGFALSTDCPNYRVFGYFVLIIILFFFFFILIQLIRGIIIAKKISYEYQGKGLTEAVKYMYNYRSGEKRWFSWLRDKSDALAEIRQLGEWVEPEEEEGEDEGTPWFYQAPLSKFNKRWGGAIGDFSGKSWWFGLWSISMTATLVIVLSLITDPLTNSLIALGLFAVDLFVMFAFLPISDLWDLGNALYMGFMRTTQIAMITSNLLETLGTEQMEFGFLILSFTAMVPAYITSMVGSLGQITS